MGATWISHAVLFGNGQNGIFTTFGSLCLDVVEVLTGGLPHSPRPQLWSEDVLVYRSTTAVSIDSNVESYIQ